MQREPPRKGGGSGLYAAPLSFESKLEKEEEFLDAMLSAHARGQLPAETWYKLHQAAQRDNRLSELAFAYESVSQGKRLKALSGAPVAEFLLQAARFFGDVFGDEFGAASYLERALVAVPAEYRVTGVKTFIVNNNGIVYQKDLGPDSVNIVKKMELYNPDSTWQRTDDEWPVSVADASTIEGKP